MAIEQVTVRPHRISKTTWVAAEYAGNKHLKNIPGSMHTTEAGVQRWIQQYHPQPAK